MTHKIFYGGSPKYSDADLKDFSDDRYECKALMRDHKGTPVAMSLNIDPDFPVWRVIYGYSCVFFPSRDTAMVFCNSRFRQ